MLYDSLPSDGLSVMSFGTDQEVACRMIIIKADINVIIIIVIIIIIIIIITL